VSKAPSYKKNNFIRAQMAQEPSLLGSKRRLQKIKEDKRKANDLPEATRERKTKLDPKRSAIMQVVG
jgi:hypothetical protein